MESNNSVGKEVSINDAPIEYSNEEAFAWVSGYNSCLEKLQPLFPQSAEEQIKNKFAEKGNRLGEIIGLIPDLESAEGVEEKIAKIIYENSSDDSECLRIKFEKIHSIIRQLTEYSQLKGKEKDEKIKQLEERVINLQQSDMTHEYNNAEAERVWPQIEQQIRDDEREKLQQLLSEKEKEIERLKGLIEAQYFKYYNDDFQNNLWETFKTENNL